MLQSLITTQLIYASGRDSCTNDAHGGGGGRVGGVFIGNFEKSA